MRWRGRHVMVRPVCGGPAGMRRPGLHVMVRPVCGGASGMRNPGRHVPDRRRDVGLRRPPKPQFRLDETGGIGYSYFNG